ncbi:MAG: DNA translocase FtsK [Lachnospiraceae bacterium]|nr:DNA translocase FtsK [Lachnospiraceae bacterium]
MVVQWFDIVGSYIVLATLEIICLLMISGRAMFKRISESIKESNAERLEKRREMNELYEQYLTSEEAEEYLESRKTGVESMLRGSGNREGVYEGEEDGDEEGYDQSSGLRVKLPVDYPEGTEEDPEEREFEESLKRSHLEKKSDRKEKDGKFNFFGGKTETKPFAAVKEEEKEVSDELQEEQPTNVPAADETADDQENDSIYESELNKKFFGKKEIRETVTTPNRAVSIFKPRAEVKEYITDGDEDLIAPENEKKEMSFSETALRDKEFSYDKEELAKTVDSVPYALSGAANRPLNYKKPVYDEKKDEVAENEDDDIFGTATENDNNLTDQYDHEGDTENEDYEEPISLLDESPDGNVERPEIGTQIVEEMNNQMAIEPLPKEYVFPPIELLDPPVHRENEDNTDELTETADKLQKTLDSFGVRVTITNVQRGPSVTRYELQPEVGVKVSRITNLADDIKLNLAAADIRIEAPIPGKAAVGIEVPNRENTMVTFRELVESDEFANAKGKIPFTVGKSIDGTNIIGDIAKMPHLMIAGATGSGKSVCINTIVMSILYEFKPEDVKLIMIDPKVVELSVYNGIPHLLIPVVTDPKKAASALNWACVEMDERYKKFAELSVRDLKGYNERVKQEAENGYVDENYPILPQMVIIVDELADLMMVASNEVEDSICRLAQKARACGMHLIIATQRPSVNVITGLIKANIPSRIAFAVSSGVDSRTILDNVGAEKLLGKGDMLYYPTGMSKPVRIQGCFVSDKEVNSVVDFITKENSPAVYSEAINEKIARANDEGKSGDARGVVQNDDGRDEYFEEAGRLIIEKEKASIGMLQRAYKIGFNRAARIMDQLAEAGVVSEEDGNKPRQILMTASDYENMLREQQ